MVRLRSQCLVVTTEPYTVNLQLQFYFDILQWHENDHYMIVTHSDKTLINSCVYGD
jgi:hypothetical protein